MLFRSAVTQRTVARELGIALGLANAYLKRCVKKGYIKIQQVPRNRYAYYLTATGFAEKSRLTTEYLYQSLRLFREARSDVANVFALCEQRGWRDIALWGVSDLCDIVALYARDFPVRLVGVVDPEASDTNCAGLPVVPGLGSFASFDAVLITDMREPQKTYDTLVKKLTAERVLAPAVLEIAECPVTVEE